MIVPPLSRPAWIVLGVNALSNLGSGLTMPFLILYLHDVRGIAFPTVGLILSTVGIAGLVTTPLTGPLIDRIGVTPAFAAGLVLGGIGIGAFVFATSPARALVAALVDGLSSGLTWNGITTLLTGLVSRAERGSALALRYMSSNVAYGAGALVTGFAVGSGSPRTYEIVLLIDAASYLLFAAALMAMPSIRHPAGETGGDGTGSDETGGDETGHDGTAGGYRRVLRDRALIGALVVNSLFMIFALSQASVTVSAWITGRGGGSTGVVGVAFGVNITVLLIAQLPVIRLSRGRSRSRAAALAALFFAASWIVLVLPASADLAGTTFTGTTRDAVLVAALGLFAIGEAVLAPTLPALVNDIAPEELRGRYNAIFSLSYQIGPIVAPALVGFALGHGAGIPYLYGLAAACLVVAVLALALRRIVPPAADLGPTDG